MFYKFLFYVSIVGVARCQPAINRMLQGTNAKEGEFPFVASIRRRASGHHSCGSSILNEKWVLTAAHCVAANKDKPFKIDIQYGVTVISDDGPDISNVKKIIVHENYTRVDYVNDIAVLLLEEPLTFSRKVKPVALPEQSYEVPKNSKATLVGWGRDKDDGVIQDHLQTVDLITFSDVYCYILHNGHIYNSHICAGVPEGGKGQCRGDSGGPLIVNGVQVGIVSWSKKPCATAPFPGVYTKVSHFVNWIKEKTSSD